MPDKDGAMPSARATHASHRARILGLGLGLSVGIAIALSGCDAASSAPIKRTKTPENCTPDGIIDLSYDRWHVETTPEIRNLEISAREYDRITENIKCLPELLPIVRQTMADGRITFAERDEIDAQEHSIRWARMDRLIKADEERAKAKLRSASEMGAGIRGEM